MISALALEEVVEASRLEVGDSDMNIVSVGVSVKDVKVLIGLAVATVLETKTVTELVTENSS